MLTQERLTKCYKKALQENEIVTVTDNTRIIFFSDVHRGDNSLSDEFAHNQNIYQYALEHYYVEGFDYFELGDGDELWEYSNFAHIRSAHSDVFCLLKKYHEAGRLKYFFGNHNMVFGDKRKAESMLQHFYDEYTDHEAVLFDKIHVKESMILRDEKTKKEILMLHGHQGDFMNDQGWMISKFLMIIFWRLMHKIGFQNPASPSKNRNKRHKIEKAYSRWISTHKIGILCGHTHRPKLPDTEEKVYLNTGCCIHPRGITGIELVNCQFFMVYWSIQPDENGFLAIRKKVIKGPLTFEEIEL